ncbi:mitochondrial ribosomal protein of small subunit [Spathaspora passalidarum NRRL Y-27907]|uniref:Mitochondrial ribosomal protein of small subunit n=1 Tax=Spathaspora passalidarum (strain NRRL Y-27907 / 11-Y1) TaxID=619300 RepID=G3ATR9_SPAPN|nr:mitochondrial ribosomal protein of small subunit [Spathaspora passalidarum NRRL Y-27907]EGW30295.1 mitochondrial ribosomal protein of small subunit [Spathaspora passalidarum NRRL Y-27907]
MGNKLLKYGGKSGILPKHRPIFKSPIRQPTPYELAEHAKIEQGIVEALPVPKHKNGKELQRVQPFKKVITVDERIQHIIERAAEKDSKIDTSKLTDEQKWKLKRDAIRREFLREAYVLEAKRLEEIDRRSEKLRIKEQQKKEAEERELLKQEEENANVGIPTVEKLLTEGMMRPRTEEEKELLQAKRVLNCHAKELIQKEARANNLLDLYHAAGNFITTEAELDEAIHKAFEVDLGKFVTNETSIEAKLQTPNLAYLTVKMNESLITDQVLGEINGKPGLDQVKEILSGETEKTKREVQMNLDV